jgi:hypothetical protein
MFFLPQKPTPSEYVVLIVFISVVFIIVGLIAIVAGIRAPAAKHELAVALEYRGGWCLGIGIAIAFGFWLLHRIMD